MYTVLYEDCTYGLKAELKTLTIQEVASNIYQSVSITCIDFCKQSHMYLTLIWEMATKYTKFYIENYNTTEIITA